MNHSIHRHIMMFTALPTRQLLMMWVLSGRSPTSATARNVRQAPGPPHHPITARRQCGGLQHSVATVQHLDSVSSGRIGFQLDHGWLGGGQHWLGSGQSRCMVMVTIHRWLMMVWNVWHHWLHFASSWIRAGFYGLTTKWKMVRLEVHDFEYVCLQ